MTSEAIILAGGLGTRLQGVIDNMPKSMAPVAGRPFLEYQLDHLDKWGLKRVVLSVGYNSDKIMAHFGHSYRSLTIEYAVEEEPLDTGGAILNAMGKIHGLTAFIFNGDTFFDVNLQRLEDFRHIKETDLCMSLRFENDTSRYGKVEFDNNNRITAYLEKGESSGEGYINGGIYLVRKDYLMNFGLPEKFSMEKDFFQRYYPTEEFYGLRCFSYFRDIGIPEDYKKAQDEFARMIYL